MPILPILFGNVVVEVVDYQLVMKNGNPVGGYSLEISPLLGFHSEEMGATLYPFWVALLPLFGSFAALIFW